ncbi:hypothetical protein A3B51_00550 [Candidatus Curtissbacteria bacterium RIFCSPLOWO2_01_FULL_41_18]|uniref:YqgF/RNase H-like domain-containing protein n=2 Tax=Candidatus Curtissiibacteriota TaxID=1752717 RepID=A0A1F5G0D7_9BACT|nr:MAG: hypothetical protein A2696_02515 [Candidatus Curtissbacteria bacterium RIFCSPHIGHO2_01_FULL_41_13]OGE04956.1 MAG: hypothetical protein A3B51_00550 [Candidatus Curtissbacteria bacterium RIFCSPLOWO2_01_FULL_41_18]
MILGVDLGQKTTGVAISEGVLASSYTTITHKSVSDAAAKIAQICDRVHADKVILGFVEGKIKSQFENFARGLKRLKPDLEITFWDETLTTRQAISTMIKLQVPKIKRAQKEHEIAASIILQSYLDSQ